MYQLLFSLAKYALTAAGAGTAAVSDDLLTQVVSGFVAFITAAVSIWQEHKSS